MFRIGEFSRIARVSGRLLRYYDQIGLLRPVRVDLATGYRYYSAGQLASLNRILALKELGLPLEQISRMIREEVSTEEIRGMLLMQRAQAEESIAQASLRLRQIESRLEQIDTHGHMKAPDVVVKSVPARVAVSVRQMLPDFAAARLLIRELLESVPRIVHERSLGELFAINHSEQFEWDEIDGQIGFLLERELDVQVPLAGDRFATVGELPAVETMATVVRIGLPELAHLATAELGRWIEANGYRICGPNREVFLQRPVPGRMEEAVVEMQFPVEKA